MPVLVGTSGWQYSHWRGDFYPRKVPQRQWLEYYAERFRTVENNSTFYRLPPREAFTQWRQRVPADFVMAVKASRYLTHVRRLRDPEEPARRFLDAAGGLGDRLGPVLIQLPPGLAADPALLDDCLAQFAASFNANFNANSTANSTASSTRASLRLAVEPRHPSWWTERTRAVLAAHNAALCWAERAGEPVTPLWRTADWGYLRFHEGTASPWPRYDEEALRAWTERVAATWPPGATVYAYFNNDQCGAAIHDAAEFARLAAEWGGQATAG